MYESRATPTNLSLSQVNAIVSNVFPFITIANALSIVSSSRSTSPTSPTFSRHHQYYCVSILHYQEFLLHCQFYERTSLPFYFAFTPPALPTEASILRPLIFLPFYLVTTLIYFKSGNGSIFFIPTYSISLINILSTRFSSSTF